MQTPIRRATTGRWISRVPNRSTVGHANGRTVGYRSARDSAVTALALRRNESTHQTEPSTVCAWCEKALTCGDPVVPVSHGVCLSCAADERLIACETLTSLSAEEFDYLPFGVIRLSSEGVILAYNQAESALSSNKPKEVIGKNFFDQVAPCTKVSRFFGEYLRLKSAQASGRKEFSFVFRFPAGAILTRIILLYEAETQNTLILVRPLVCEFLLGKQPKKHNSSILCASVPVQTSELFRISDAYYLSTDKGQVGISLNESPRTFASQTRLPAPPESYPPDGDVAVLVKYLLSIIQP
jgi:photoactive yellow protein